MWKIKDEVCIVICGAAGQGIQTVEDGLTAVCKNSGYNVFSAREYMSRVRGGINSTSIRISSKPVRAFVDRIDIFLPLSELAIPHLMDHLTNHSIIIGEQKLLEGADCGNCVKIPVPFEALAIEIGNKVFSNIITLGVLSGILDVDERALHDSILELFPMKGDNIVDANMNAAKKGYEIARKMINEEKLLSSISIKKDSRIKKQLILDGAEAAALGAIAGGCNFEAFYPMAPSTGIATFLAQHALDFSLIVDQSEDEISAMNKAIGASFAGARAMVTTSGGGFSLMNEGLSLCGATEIPLVIIVGQRPGPATGMPTRTEQGELDHVLYAGSGEFPRIIFAPGDIEDLFYLTQNAFNLADEFQVPVFILPDQYLTDITYNIPTLHLDDLKIKKYFIKMPKNYVRYKFTETGISPRGIPGYGEGLTIADGHTHSEDGHISEDPIIRSRMVEKYIKKLDQVKKVALKPKLVGDLGYKILILCWGSLYHPILEVLERMHKKDVAVLHFSQVYPIYSGVVDYLKKAEKIILVENNSSAQFGKLLQLETGMKFETKILKYSGYCFSVEELEREIAKKIGP